MIVRIAVFLCIAVFALGAFLFVVDALNPYTPDPLVLWRALILAILFFLILQMYANNLSGLSIAHLERFICPCVTNPTPERDSLGLVVPFSLRI
jgi:hypothetical protein